MGNGAWDVHIKKLINNNVYNSRKRVNQLHRVIVIKILT